MPDEKGAGSDSNDVSVLNSIHEFDENQWNNLVAQTERGTLFQRYEWLAAVEEGLGVDAHHVVVSKAGNPVAVVPNFVSTLATPVGAVDLLASALGISVMKSGWTMHGGPVIASDERENLDRLFDALDATTDFRFVYRRISTYDLGQIRYGEYLRSRGYEPRLDNATFVIDLSEDWDDILSNMDSSRRRTVRRAHEQEYSVEMDPLGADLYTTYEMYAKNTERVGGSVLDLPMFEILQNDLADRVRVFTARVDGETVGRYVYLLDTENSTLHHWLSAIPDRECHDAHPSELMHTRAIKWGIDQGFDDYCFGPAGSHFDNSVFRFKTQYGARAVPVLRWEKGGNPLVWPLFKRVRQRLAERDL